MTPQSVAATKQNTQLLEQWLASVSPGGDIDPLQAIEIALRMNSSASFMLSDGEFHASRRRKPILPEHPDGFSVVAAANGRVAIHAVAFEELGSRNNVERLADMTGGQFRFIEAVTRSPSILVSEAKNIIAASNRFIADLLMRRAT